MSTIRRKYFLLFFMSQNLTFQGVVITAYFSDFNLENNVISAEKDVKKIS